MGRYFGDVDKTWEIPVDQWDEKRHALRLLLEDVARREGVIPYGDIAREIGGFSAPNSRALADLLGEVARDSEEAGMGLLSAVAVYANDYSEVSVGFINIAKALGRPNVPNGKEAQRDYWLGELGRVHEAYSRST